MKSDFEERKNNRIERFTQQAQNARKQAESAFKTADAISSCIPFGQPILVGHHSEKRHRRAVDKIHNSMRKGIEENKKADYLDARAVAAASNRAIFSDDPNATEKLAEKIERLESRQDMMKAANKMVKKNDREGLLNAGFSDNQITQLFEPDFCGRLGFPSYLIMTYDSGVKIIVNVKDNRTQILLPIPIDRVEKPIYDLLKRNGFRRTREGVWQRHISNGALWSAQHIEKQFAESVKLD